MNFKYLRVARLRTDVVFANRKDESSPKEWKKCKHDLADRRFGMFQIQDFAAFVPRRMLNLFNAFSRWQRSQEIGQIEHAWQRFERDGGRDGMDDVLNEVGGVMASCIINTSNKWLC